MKLEFNKQELDKLAGGMDRSSFVDEYAVKISSTPIVIKKIGLVGFYADGKIDEGLSNPLDKTLLRVALRSFEISSNISLSSLVSTKIINADSDHGGLDFFDQEEDFDLLLMGNIFIPSNPTRMTQSYGFGLGGRDCYVSHKCSHVKQWAEKSEELSAKMIFTLSCGASLDINYFEQYGDYSVLQHESSNNGKTGIAIHNNLSL